jgi:hypothetical protein
LQENGGMKAMHVVIAVVVAAAIGAGAYWWWQQRDPPYLPPPVPKAQAPDAPQGPQPPKHPVPQSEAKPLPALAASDGAIQPEIVRLLGLNAFERLVNPEEIIRRTVATVDNLPRDQVATRLNPVRPVGGLVTTKGRDATLVLSPDNFKRYAPYVGALEAVDAKALASVYFHFYPLFQQAYVELGYPNGHFNDRLVEVIDHLLAAPEVKGPIRLVTPKVLHEYADEDLESRSAGQKVLIRMGAENAARVKAKLREIRAQVARGPAP